jgi:hypothetical protein
LSALGAADLVDVLHYYFEEDANVSSGEQAEARDAMRTTIYRDLYGKTYRYGSSKSQTTDFSDLDDPMGGDMPMPMDPMQKTFSSKPFVPATDFEEGAYKPFGNVLDAPLG